MFGKAYESDLHVRCPASHNIYTYVNYDQLRNIKRQCGHLGGNPTYDHINQPLNLIHYRSGG